MATTALIIPGLGDGIFPNLIFLARLLGMIISRQNVIKGCSSFTCAAIC